MIQTTFANLPPQPSESLSQWFTPQNLADRIVLWANVRPGDKVLEPSAGSGAFVVPLLDAGASVTAVEIDPRWADALRDRCGGQDLTVVNQDFKSWGSRERFDLTIQNPPYEDDQDCAHVETALSMSDRVVALVRANFLHGVGRKRRIWDQVRLTRMIHLSSRPHFSGAGSPRHDFTVVEMVPKRLPAPGGTVVEWWS